MDLPAFRQLQFVGHWSNAPGNKKGTYEFLLKLACGYLFQLQVVSTQQHLVSYVEHLLSSPLVSLDLLPFLRFMQKELGSWARDLLLPGNARCILWVN